MRAADPELDITNDAIQRACTVTLSTCVPTYSGFPIMHFGGIGGGSYTVSLSGQLQTCSGFPISGGEICPVKGPRVLYRTAGPLDRADLTLQGLRPVSHWGERIYNFIFLIVYCDIQTERPISCCLEKTRQ